MAGSTLPHVFTSADARDRTVRASQLVLASLRRLDWPSHRLDQQTDYKRSTLRSYLAGRRALPWRLVVFAMCHDRDLLPKLQLLLNP